MMIYLIRFTETISTIYNVSRYVRITFYIIAIVITVTAVIIRNGNLV